MTGLLDLDGLQRRMSGYVERQASFGEQPPESVYLLREALLRGRFPARKRRASPGARSARPVGFCVTF
jgi:hypothetical protein